MNPADPGQAVIFTIGMTLALGAIYFFPSFMAAFRKHNNLLAIGVTNFFFGWTVLGWIGSLIWAMSDNVRAPAIEGPHSQ